VLLFVACQHISDLKRLFLKNENLIVNGHSRPPYKFIDILIGILSPYSRGIGRELIVALEAQAKASGHKRTVLDARKAAVDFYQKTGYKITEKSYLLFDVIQHYRMVKKL